MSSSSLRVHLPTSGRLGLAAAVAALSISLPAAAQDTATTPPPVSQQAPKSSGVFSGTGGGFGLPRQLAIGTDLSLKFIFNPSGDTNEFHIVPAGDYFVIPHLSVGGLLGMIIQTGAGDAKVFLVGLRGGYSLPLGESFSLWPKLGFNFLRESRVSGALTLNGSTMAMVLLVPILWHVTYHFFLGFGPMLSVDLYKDFGGMNQDKYTIISLESLIGGFFDL